MDVPDLDHVFDARVGVTFDERLDPDQRLDVGGETVRHQLKLAVGRNKRNGTIALKRRQFDTLTTTTTTTTIVTTQCESV